jgi:peptide/nickel transport system permease protein
VSGAAPLRQGAVALATGMGLVALVILSALLAPWLSAHDPNVIDLAHRLQAPSATHWAGTDEVGRDLLSRVLWGGRASLAVGLAVVVVASLIGVVVGALSGLAGGAWDHLVMRAVDTVMALPGLVVAMALTAVLGPSLFNSALALALLASPAYIRMARGHVLAIRQLDYLRASQAMGAGMWHRLTVHVLPNIAAPMLVLMTLHIGPAILSAATLSFLGLGAQAPLAEWGALINSGRQFILEQWWVAVIPGLAIVLAVTGFNLLGDGLRDRFDPKARGQTLLDIDRT